MRERTRVEQVIEDYQRRRGVTPRGIPDPFDETSGKRFLNRVTSQARDEFIKIDGHMRKVYSPNK